MIRHISLFACLTFVLTLSVVHAQYTIASIQDRIPYTIIINGTLTHVITGTARLGVTVPLPSPAVAVATTTTTSAPAVADRPLTAHTEESDNGGSLIVPRRAEITKCEVFWRKTITYTRTTTTMASTSSWRRFRWNATLATSGVGKAADLETSAITGGATSGEGGSRALWILVLAWMIWFGAAQRMGVTKLVISTRGSVLTLTGPTCAGERCAAPTSSFVDGFPLQTRSRPPRPEPEPVVDSIQAVVMSITQAMPTIRANYTDFMSEATWDTNMLQDLPTWWTRDYGVSTALESEGVPVDQKADEVDKKAERVIEPVGIAMNVLSGLICVFVICSGVYVVRGPKIKAAIQRVWANNF